MGANGIVSSHDENPISETHRARPAGLLITTAMPDYAELGITSNFSFLRGASHPEELVVRAQELGLAALSLTDRNSFAGLVRAHVKAKEVGLRFVPGCRLDLIDAPSLLCWPTDRQAYARLSSLLTTGKRRAPKGECHLSLEDVLEHADGQIMALLEPCPATAGTLSEHLGACLYMAVSSLYRGDDAVRIEEAAALGLPLLATGDVHYHAPARRPLQDVVTCIREHCTIADAGGRLAANAERHLKPPAEMARLFERWPEALAASMEIIERCRFSLDELAYDYPVAESYDGRTPQEELERRTWLGASGRYPDGVPEKVRRALDHELGLIAQLSYAPYFLTVDEIVGFARSREILCQGRGSAANSAVCYALGVTAVDPARIDLLFERFISAERNEPPDIDVDFEHERREEVIQHIYERWGRDHAALCATVIRYRAKSAIRETGKVMGLSTDATDALSKSVWGHSREGLRDDRVREAGLDPDDPRVERTLELARELIDFPRHLSQHVGGFVIAKSPLRELVPIENAAMDDRTVVEWDKDDIDALGMLKIDCLALGMLTCIRKSFDLLRLHHGIDIGLADVPPEDPAVYAMLQEADSIGVFQVESRAQMSMLPRLRPRCFYDLVIEVAIVRPGPIQGDMVHPYLRRRDGIEPVEFPSEELREVLGKTLGVPLFQEQAMRIAMVAAGFTAAEADGLRRSMAAFRRLGHLEHYRDKMIHGMVARGYDAAFAERCFKQIEGFGYYGFPESHAASFALLVYVSAWLKHHHPDVFCAAILNSQPMGFYAPAQLVRDATDHGVEVRHPDVDASYWDCTLEGPEEPPTDGTRALSVQVESPERSESAAEQRAGAGDRSHLIGNRSRQAPGYHAVRLGFRQIKGFRLEDAIRITAARLRPYGSPADLRRRAGLDRRAIERLAEADAFRSASMDRRRALWEAKALKDRDLPLFAHAEAAEDASRDGQDGRRGHNRGAIEAFDEPWLELPPMTTGEHVLEDYSWLRLSLKAHPMALLRGSLPEKPVLARDLWSMLPGSRIAVAGLVLVRQRPGSASGVVFATLEDETGFANCVIWPNIFEQYRAVIMRSRLLLVHGRLQREGRVIHVVAERLTDWTGQLQRLRLGHRSSAETTISPSEDDSKAGELLPKGRDFH